jgi:nucleoside-diphosphate-sugar epimerase
MQVMVTGSAGKIGREAVKQLRAAGHKVTGLDLKGGLVDGARTVACDCTDFGQVLGALSGVDTMPRPDAIVHLAGIPAPGLAPDATIFATNTVSTYNIFSAAARLGIARVAWGSSETILGLPFSTPPAFAPLDETHPDRPEWSYSLTKKLGEDMADEFTRWHPNLTIVSLRFSNVFDAADYAGHSAILKNPAPRKANMWGYVDARDAGEACRLAIEAELSGHHRMVIAAADTVVETPSAELMATHWPEVPVRGPLAGNASLLSSATAERLIGYRPRHSWRTQ